MDGEKVGSLGWRNRGSGRENFAEVVRERARRIYTVCEPSGKEMDCEPERTIWTPALLRIFVAARLGIVVPSAICMDNVFLHIRRDLLAPHGKSCGRFLQFEFWNRLGAFSEQLAGSAAPPAITAY